MNYVIRGTQDGERLWWSDTWGWTGSLEEATVYTAKHDRWSLIPAKGASDVAWEDLPDIVCPKCGQEFTGTNESERTTIADHGHCYDCQSEWEHADDHLGGELD